jgi:hypothetical protein
MAFNSKCGQLEPSKKRNKQAKSSALTLRPAVHGVTIADGSPAAVAGMPVNRTGRIP